jgi:hypothetical protein
VVLGCLAFRALVVVILAVVVTFFVVVVILLVVVAALVVDTFLLVVVVLAGVLEVVLTFFVVDDARAEVLDVGADEALLVVLLVVDLVVGAWVDAGFVVDRDDVVVCEALVEVILALPCVDATDGAGPIELLVSNDPT